jgi:hypothetical protein
MTCPNCLKLREALIRAGDTLYSVTKTGDWPDEVMEALQFITKALTQPQWLSSFARTHKSTRTHAMPGLFPKRKP